MFCPKCGEETTENAAFCAGCGASLAGGQPLKRGRLSTAAGTLDIVAGWLGILSVLSIYFFAAALWFLAEGVYGQEFGFESDSGSFIMEGAAVVCSILAIVSGVLVLRGKNRAMAFVGAIAAIFPIFSLGIAAVVLTVMARDEFERWPTSR